MFDLGMGELLVIGIVALIVIGPKDLPGMFQTLGRFTAKLRAMSRDFSRAMEQAAKDSGADEVARDLKAVANPRAMGLEKVREAADRFEKWDPVKNAARPTPPSAPLTPPPMPPVPVAAPSTAPATAPVTALGPATRELAEKKAARAAIAREAAEKLRAVDAPPPPPAPPAEAGLPSAETVKKPGRVRAKKPVGDVA